MTSRNSKISRKKLRLDSRECPVSLRACGAQTNEERAVSLRACGAQADTGYQLREIQTATDCC